MLLRKQTSLFAIEPQNEEHIYDCYRNHVDFVRRFIHQTILNVTKTINNLGDLTFDHRLGTFTRKLGYFGNNWPTCGNFNPRNGLESIINEMESWNELSALKDWMFHVTFVGLRQRNRIDVYIYHVLWSVPTPAYPEPQVTVSVYFYVESTKIYPPKFPVDISYIFEGQQFTHSIHMIFRPKWLYDILDMKTMMFKTFNF